MSYINLFLIAWSLTVLTETSTYVILIKWWQNKTSCRQILFAGILTSSCTLPYLWFVLPEFWSGQWLIFWGELLVFLIEIVILNGLLNLGWKKSLLLSLIANLASYGLGLVIMPYLF